MSVAVVYIARGKDAGMEAAIKFFTSYKMHNSGMNHSLYVVQKGWGDDYKIKALEKLCAEVSAKVVPLPDNGYDWGAYIRIAPTISEKYILFLNSHSEILTDNWLSIFYKHLNKEGIGAVGATGSWSTWSYSRPYWEPSFKSSIQFFIRLLFEIKKYLVNGRKYPCFPNPHLRSNAFMIENSIFQDYCKTKLIPLDKADSHLLESGFKSLSNYLKNKNLKILVCGKNSESYSTSSWPISNTFRSVNQENLIIADRQCRIYFNSSDFSKRVLSFKSWGDRKTK